MTSTWLTRNLELLWRIGVEHRETLMVQHMAEYGLTERPPIQNVYRDLIGEIQRARIIDAPLPMDRYAQTELDRKGRAEITLNSLIGRMPGVKDEHGIAHVGAWHESIHILVDVERREIPPLTDLTSGLEGSTSSPLLCEVPEESLRRWNLREQAIDAAALAAAVADADLRRCTNYLKFLRLAAQGDDMGSEGWRLLAWIATAIGVNRTALRRYFEQHGICRFTQEGGTPRLIGTQQPFGGFVCLEPESASIRSIA
jgi:hypothetical protein